MIDNRTPVDRAILVGAPTRDVSPEAAKEHLEELARLTDTAGGTVAGIVEQRISRPTPALYIGKGKAEELAGAVDLTNADLVIFDEDLSPVQGQNLEKTLGVRVMDRSELILDIFATRARSREAMLQVELAQLQYLLPRLTRMWSHLSRIRGGIGLRGPGETQLETDRRLIGKRIADLRVKLREVARSRAARRKGRAGSFRAALVGYTNAGKSSLLAALSGADVFIEDRLFATLDAMTRSVHLDGGHTALVTDTVGFIRKLPHHLVASFRSTLEEAREADVLLHVVDASHPDWEERMDVVAEVLEELELLGRPTALVFNKVDLISTEALDALRGRVRAFEPHPSLFVSAHSTEGTEALKAFLGARIRNKMVSVQVKLPADSGSLIATLHREGDVEATCTEGATLVMEARLPHALVGRIRSMPGVEVEEGQGP